MRDSYEMDNFRRDMGALGIFPSAATIGIRHNLEVCQGHHLSSFNVMQCFPTCMVQCKELFECGQSLYMACCFMMCCKAACISALAYDTLHPLAMAGSMPLH